MPIRTTADKKIRRTMGFARRRDHARSLARRLLRVTKPTSDEEPGLRVIRSVSLESAFKRDRIVRTLLDRHLVESIHIESAWIFQQDRQDRRPLWRVLADVQGVDSAAVFRCAAGMYAFEEANVSIVGSQILASWSRSQITDRQWHLLVENGIFPIRETNDSLEGGVRWTYVSFDPANPRVRQIVRAVAGESVRVKFLAPSYLFAVIRSCTRFAYVHSLWWYRRYVLGHLPIPVRVEESEPQRRRAA